MTAASLDALLAHHRSTGEDALLVYDEYPSLAEPKDRSLGLVVDAVLENLSPDDRAAIELYVLAGLTYRQTADRLGWHNPSGPDKKKAQRHVKHGLAVLEELLSSGWRRAIAYRVPS